MPLHKSPVSLPGANNWSHFPSDQNYSWTQFAGEKFELRRTNSTTNIKSEELLLGIRNWSGHPYHQNHLFLKLCELPPFSPPVLLPHHFHCLSLLSCPFHNLPV